MYKTQISLGQYSAPEIEIVSFKCNQLICASPGAGGTETVEFDDWD